MENIFIEDYKINKFYEVEITHINNPHSFYIRSTHCKSSEILEKCGRPALISELLLGSTVVYRSQICNKFLRGNIIGVNKLEQTFVIFAVDYGHSDRSVSIEDIFKPEAVVILPPLARHCKLSNCEPRGCAFTDNDTEAMKTFVGNEHCLMQVQAIRGPQMIVKLQNSCPNDIATMLCLSQNTYFQKETDMSASRNTFNMSCQN